MTIGKFAQDRIQCAFGDIRIEPTQGIVRTEFKDDRVGAIRHRPIETAEAAGGCITGNPRIGDRDRNGFGF